MAIKAYDSAPHGLSDLKSWCRKLADKINDILVGKQNVTVSLTLRASQTTTTLTDPRIGPSSAIIPAMATTAHAAAAIAAGIYVTNQLSGSAVLNHASSANSDQTIVFVIIG